MPLLAMRSISGTAALYSVLATALLPAVTAANTFLIWVRILERSVMLWLRRLMLWRARLRADLILATKIPRFVLGLPGLGPGKIRKAGYFQGSGYPSQGRLHSL
jgi:hypothetical protein